jgi:hypothetical protein
MLLVPEFATLIKRDKGTPRKEAGKSVRVFLQSRREFTFIYFYMDFGSPIYDYEDNTRRKEALHYADMTEENLDKYVWAAAEKYEEIMLNAARSLRTYKALLKMLDALDSYMENLDFAQVTKTGELRNSPDKVAGTVSKMDAVHTSVENFRKRVDTELKQQGSIRGAATLGDNEGVKKAGNWSEADIAKGSAHSSEGVDNAGNSTGRSMDHMLKKIQSMPITKVETILDDEDDSQEQ